MNIGSYTIIKGNVFEDKCEEPKILAHVCNNIGAWGAGFTKALDMMDPRIGSTYKSHIQKHYGNKLMGTNMLFELSDEKIWIACMIAQEGLPSSTNSKPIKYVSLTECMVGVRKSAHIDYNVKNIICPRFGSGLARGTWAFIEELIHEIWVDRGLNVRVYDL